MSTFFCLAVAFILGGLIGLERQYRQRNAGMQTNILVAVGSAVFVNLAQNLFGDEGAIRVAACVVSGIGFLGAGVIMREAGTVFGLNTAAILWCSAAVGSCAGGGLHTEALIATLFILVTNMLLIPLAGAMNKRPIALSDQEGVCAIFVIAGRKNGKEALAVLRREFRDRNYHFRRLDVVPFGSDELKILAVLNASSADEKKLDLLVDSLSEHETIHQSFWSHGVTV